MVEIIMLHFTSVMFKFVLEESSTPIIGRHRSTAYVDATYCYRPSSMVCLSVCFEYFGWPEEPCLRWGSRSPMGRGNFEVKRGDPL